MPDVRSGQSSPRRHGVPNFIDLAVPVSSTEGTTSGILGATLSENWADEVKDTLLGSMKETIPVDVIVLDAAGQVLLGPDNLAGMTLLCRASRRPAPAAPTSLWSDGRTAHPTLRGFQKAVAIGHIKGFVGLP